MSYCEIKSLLLLTHSLDPSWSDRSVTVQKARDPIASANRIFIRDTPKYSGCEEINGRAGADLIGSAGAVSPAEQSFQPGQRIQSGPVRESTET